MTFMRILGFCLFGLAMVSYMTTIMAISALLRESRQHRPGTRLNLFWWIPAWQIHRGAYPVSPLRKQIVTRFITTFVLMSVGMVCVGVDVIRHSPIR